MAMELVWPYVTSVSNPSVSGYLDWAKNQKDELYKLKYEQVRGISIIEILVLTEYLHQFFRSFGIYKP
jgi:hypothetical protein